MIQMPSKSLDNRDEEKTPEAADAADRRILRDSFVSSDHYFLDVTEIKDLLSFFITKKQIVSLSLTSHICDKRLDFCSFDSLLLFFACN